MSPEVIAAGVAPDEVEFEASLRPSMLAEFVGQEQVKRQVGLIIEAARNRGAPPDHLLFSGPPGLGKTSLAHIIANEVGVNLRPTSGPSLEGDGAVEIARRSRGTPRIANRLLRRVRDYAEVKASGVIDRDVARAALELFDVDELGLDTLDAKVLHTLIEKFGGGPVGITSLAAALSEETDTIEDVSEPYLLQIGFLQRTPRGRVATERAYAHLGVAQEPGNPTLL